MGKGISPWFTKPKVLLQKRAVIANSAEELIRHISSYLENGTYPADPNNTEFLEEYGSNQGLNLVKRNVINVLNEVIVK